MTVPGAPLPRIGSLLSALKASAFTGERWSNDQRGHAVRIYRYGRLSLAAGVQAVRKATPNGRVTVWVPGYFCNESLDPLRGLPVALRFYPIREDLTPDWPAFEERTAGESGRQIFILVHYFGFPNATEESRKFCDRHEMVLLEDAAHVLFPVLSMGLGDLLVFSPRKLLAVPSGSVLVISRGLAPYLVDSPRDARVGDTLFWLARRLTQEILMCLHVPWHHLRRALQESPFSSNANGMGRTNVESCDPYALRLLTVMEQGSDEVIRRRRNHYMELLDLTSELGGARPLFPFLPDGVCPYAFPMLLERGSKDVVARLRDMGIPASQWPDLPPEVLASREEHRIAIRTYEHLLLLAVHQSLSRRQVETVGHGVGTALSGGL